MISKPGVSNKVTLKIPTTSTLNPKDKKKDTQSFASSVSSGSTQVTMLFTSSTTSTTSSEENSYFSASTSNVQPIEFHRLWWENPYVDGDENKGFCKEYTKIAKLSVEEKIEQLNEENERYSRRFIVSQLSECSPTEKIVDALIKVFNGGGEKRECASAAQALAKLQPQDKILRNKIIKVLLASLKDDVDNKASLIHELTAYSLSKLLPLDEGNLIIPELITILQDVTTKDDTYYWIELVFKELIKRYDEGEQIISASIYNLLQGIVDTNLMMTGITKEVEIKLQNLLDKYNQLLDPEWDISSADVSICSDVDYTTARESKLFDVQNILKALKTLSPAEVEQFENVTELCRADLHKNDPSKKNQAAINDKAILTSKTKNAVKEVAVNSRGFSFRHNKILNITWKKARAKVLGKDKYEGIKTDSGYDRQKLSAKGTPLYNDVRKEWPEYLLDEFKRIQDKYQFKVSEFEDKADARLYKKLCSRQIRNKTDERAAIHHVGVESRNRRNV